MANNKETKTPYIVTPERLLKLIQERSTELTKLVNILTDYICEAKKEA